ncbi:hypothetical protein FAZ69_31785 [Trinickia terrae]|uniref:Uncharacterized protein n=1 Tax=Trinickia terrae TaxID=2571161 RepID=A0A4U1HD76_9BURK|nr:hypothetical protein FAZ69_31785 [Trinickia terrae]
MPAQDSTSPAARLPLQAALAALPALAKAIGEGAASREARHGAADDGKRQPRIRQPARSRGRSDAAD